MNPWLVILTDFMLWVFLPALFVVWLAIGCWRVYQGYHYGRR